jgi:hypothetical protein
LSTAANYTRFHFILRRRASKRLGKALNVSFRPKVTGQAAHLAQDDLAHHEQPELFASKSHAVVEAMDEINDKYGECVITPALMMGMDDTIIDRIAFGGVKELEELYQQ